MARIIAVLLSLLVIVVAPLARADEAATPAETSSRHEMPWVSVRYNPLGLLIGRKSGDVEVWPTDHISVIVTPWMADYDQSAQTDDKGSGASNASLHLTGLEAGVRYWPMHMTKSAFRLAPFAGLNGGGAWGRFDTWSSESYSSQPLVSTRVQQVIVAAEAGIAVTAGPAIVELGLGIQGTQSSGVDPHGPTFWDCSVLCVDGMHFYYGNGVLPRVLLSAGFAF